MIRRWALPVMFGLLSVRSAVAQEGLKGLLPTDQVAGRYGLVRRWYAVAPVDGIREKVQSVTVAGDQIHLQTNASRIHVLDGESGKLLWTAQVGRPNPGQMGSAINSKSVFVINGTSLYRLDRLDGSLVWSFRLPEVPNAAPAADEQHVLVSTAEGRVYLYSAETQEVIWYYQTNAPVSVPAALLDEKIVCASEDGMLYVFQASSRNPILPNYKTGTAVSAPLAVWGRLVLLPSRDFTLYAVDVRTRNTAWLYASGAEIREPVSVADNDVFVMPEDYGLHVLKLNAENGELVTNPKTGKPLWWWYPRAQHFVAASPTRVYAGDKYGQLVLLERSTGRLLGVWDTHAFDFRVRNESNDRLYLATRSGLVVCLHEKENKEPVAHRRVIAPPAAGPEPATGPGAPATADEPGADSP